MKSIKEKTLTGLKDGFSIRPPTMNDLEITVDLFNAYSKHYLGIEDADIDSLRNEWNSPGYDPETSSQLAFSPEGKLVGYIEVYDAENPPVQPWIWGRVHPDYENLGIGTFIMNWAEERVQQALERVPEGLRVAFRSGANNKIQTHLDFLENNEMELIRHFFRMIIEMDEVPPEPIFPEGICLKIYDPEKDAEAVYRADVEAFRDHFGFVEEPFEEGFPRFMHHMTEHEAHDPNMWFMAMDGDEVAGICLNRQWSWEDKDCGHVSSLGVRRPWRKKGLGLALLLHSFGEFYRRGKRKVSLGVDADSLTGALKLYEKAGMRVHRQFDMYEKVLRPGEDISVQTLE